MLLCQVKNVLKTKDQTYSNTEYINLVDFDQVGNHLIIRRKKLISGRPKCFSCIRQTGEYKIQIVKEAMQEKKKNIKSYKKREKKKTVFNE